jgi:diacylglycerol O-acyltransferase
VPVSVRAPEGKGEMGNQITIMVAPLAVGVADPVERLAVVRKAMQNLKESKQALGARLMTTMEDFLPPTVLAQASRLGFSSRLYNLLVTNVPGPQFPVYIMGRELLDLAPLAFLAPEHALAIAIVSYNGAVTFGLLADSDAIPDLDVLAKDLQISLDELQEAAVDALAAKERSEAAPKARTRLKSVPR